MRWKIRSADVAAYSRALATLAEHNAEVVLTHRERRLIAVENLSDELREELASDPSMEVKAELQFVPDDGSVRE